MYELFMIKYAESGIKYEYYLINVCKKFSLKFDRPKADHCITRESLNLKNL